MRSTLPTSNFTRQPCRHSSVCVCVCQCLDMLPVFNQSTRQNPNEFNFTPDLIICKATTHDLKISPGCSSQHPPSSCSPMKVVIQKSHLHHQPSSTIIMNHHQPSSTVINRHQPSPTVTNQSPVIYRIQGHLVKEAF